MAIDINQATAEELSMVKGVSPQAAAAIIEYRNEQGGLSSLSEIAEISGCDEGTIKALEEGGVEVSASIEADDY